MGDAMAVSITPHLWYAEKALEAARFYASIIPDSRVDRVTTMPVDSPAGPPGSVTVVELTLAGAPFVAMSAGPLDPFNHAVSFVLGCDSQEEIDQLWDALLDGGTHRAVRLATRLLRPVLAGGAQAPGRADGRLGPRAGSAGRDRNAWHGQAGPRSTRSRLSYRPR